MSLWSSRKSVLPAAGEALPGRAERMRVPERHFVNGHRLEPPFPDGMQLALFGLGCFWGAERKFWVLPGVYSTAVGYAAGQTPNPTYEEVCTGLTGHSEVVRVVFDPARIGYGDLLRVFWESHDPTQGMRQGNDVGTQYRSGIYVSDAMQRELARVELRCVPGAAHRGGIRFDHDRDTAGAGVLLRRGLPPAVPGEESEWLLRDRRLRDRLRSSGIGDRPTVSSRAARI